MRWAAVLGTGLFALFFLVGGVDRFSPHRIGESLALIAIGVALGVLAWRIWLYYRRPCLSLVGDVLTWRPFWRRACNWSAADITGLTIETERITRSAGKRLPVPVTIQRLEITTQDGARSRLVLPRFRGGNDALVATLAERSGTSVTHTRKGF